ncbi:hypothetical protein BBO99_00001935 [Phytophthora kernoviae]|uniref:Uncharacterized protein n=1 Tax=Phytophthora kernoviae TaxID=325452 RepID=A0A3R7K994_9STRA|nr:hypothetical protein JM16_003784 [Phytophthora kernoviae]RLN37517.1 hypothetical protein BBI17_001837 [Phytophthora kernoviae]RLN83626.1 hypothetical protein BBO99_00001935 [Phytophthora kernoviae]
MTRFMTVDKELVKQKLRQEQQSWEEEQIASDCSEAPSLQIWTVGKLLRVIEASGSHHTLTQHLWLTGFLRFCDEDEEYDTLHLCDANTELKSFLLDPNPQLVDRLVLVKNWVLVDKAFRGVRTADSLFLEVQDEKPIMLQPPRELSLD